MGIPKRKPQTVPSVDDLVHELIDDPDRWLDTKNDQLGGKKPKQLIGTEQEPVLRNLLEAIKHGTFS